MSVIAYDGKVIAADKQATCGDLIRTVTKLVRLESGVILGWTGSQDRGLTLARWWREGADPESYPEFQLEEDWCRLVVLQNGRLVTYEQSPDCFEMLERCQAFGSGRDFAIGAMEVGASAVRAAEVACKFSAGCGCGVDWFEVGK